MRDKSQEIYCFDINVGQEGVWDGTNEYHHSVKETSGDTHIAPHQMVIFEYKQNSDKLNLITDNKDISYGKKIIYKTENKSYVLIVRKYGFSELGYKINEKDETYLKYMFFLKNAFEKEQLYSEEHKTNNKNDNQLEIEI
jgi:hypothetical protein